MYGMRGHGGLVSLSGLFGFRSCGLALRCFGIIAPLASLSCPKLSFLIYYSQIEEITNISLVSFISVMKKYNFYLFDQINKNNHQKYYHT